MYTTFTLRNFRCFGDLTIPELGRVNLIAGKNNVGKTAFLEGMFMHCGAFRPELVIKIQAFRGYENIRLELGPSSEPLWLSIFKDFDVTQTVELAGTDEVTGLRTLRLRALSTPDELARAGQYIRPLEAGSDAQALSSMEAQVLELTYEYPSGKGTHYLVVDAKQPRTAPIPAPLFFPAFILPAERRLPFREIADRLATVQVESQTELLLKALQRVEPRLRSIELLFQWGEPVLHGRLDGLSRPIPLAVMGDGMGRLANIIIHIVNARRGVLLVDEIENGLHYSVLAKIWEVIIDAAAEFGCQVVATTHSHECVVAAYAAAKARGDDQLRYHRLDSVRGAIRAVTYGLDALEGAINADVEVR